MKIENRRRFSRVDVTIPFAITCVEEGGLTFERQLSPYLHEIRRREVDPILQDVLTLITNEVKSLRQELNNMRAKQLNYRTIRVNLSEMGISFVSPEAYLQDTVFLASLLVDGEQMTIQCRVIASCPDGDSMRTHCQFLHHECDFTAKKLRDYILQTRRSGMATVDA